MTKARFVAALLAVTMAGSVAAIATSAAASNAASKRGPLCVEKTVGKHLHAQVGYCP